MDPKIHAELGALPAVSLLLVTSGGCVQLTACRISSGATGGSSCCCAFGPGSGASLSDCTLVGGEINDEACVLALSGASVRLRGSLLQVRSPPHLVSCFISEEAGLSYSYYARPLGCRAPGPASLQMAPEPA